MKINFKLENVFVKHYAPNHMLAIKPMITNRKKSEKGRNSSQLCMEFIQNFNYVIYTLDTNCEPNSMILAQAVIQIFCSQCPFWLICLCLKRGITLSNIHRILWKVNQAVYIMVCIHTVCLISWSYAQVVLQLVMPHNCFTIQNAKVGKGT